jgi:hypothetical protein
LKERKSDDSWAEDIEFQTVYKIDMKFLNRSNQVLETGENVADGRHVVGRWKNYNWYYDRATGWSSNTYYYQTRNEFEKPNSYNRLDGTDAIETESVHEYDVFAFNGNGIPGSAIFGRYGLDQETLYNPPDNPASSRIVKTYDTEMLIVPGIGQVVREFKYSQLRPLGTTWLDGDMTKIPYWAPV